MGAFRDLSEMVRDFGLGIRYFFLVVAILGAMLAALVLWGRTGRGTADPGSPPPPDGAQTTR